MPSFGTTSKERLSTCHIKLQWVMEKVVEQYDITVICGHRDEQAQNDAYHNGYSKTQWPNSKHNQMPSIAVDIAPYPIDWNNTDRFIYMAGLVMGIASEMGITLRWGGNWDRDQQILAEDQTFQDYGHFELVEV